MKLAMPLLLLLFQTGPAEPGDVPTSGVTLEQLYEQAVAAVSNSEWTEAINRLTSILEQDPSHLPSRFYLAVSLTGQGEVDRAIETYREILAADATVFAARMNLGALLVDSGKASQAVDEFRLATELAPSDPTPALYLAQVLDQLDRVGDAIDAYLAVLDRPGTDGPAALEAYRRVGGLYLRSGEPERAERMLTEAARLDTEDPFIFAMLGDLHSAAGELDQARKSYERARELDPESRDLRLSLALVLRDMNLPRDAITILETMDDVDAILADSYIAAERYADAVPFYERLTRTEPDNAGYWSELGKSYYETGDLDRAIPALEQATTLDTESVDAWGVLALIYSQENDWVRTGNALVRYLELRPDHVPSIFLLAVSYDNLGDHQRALVHYNRFIALDDGSDDARSFQVRQRAQSLERALESGTLESGDQ